MSARLQKIPLWTAIVWLLPPLCAAQWVSFNGPYGGVVTSLGVIGTSVYAGAGGAVYRSTNNGSIWTGATAGIMRAGIQQIFVLGSSGNKLLVGTYNALYESTDSGATWTPASSGGIGYYVRGLVTSGNKVLFTELPPMDVLGPTDRRYHFHPSAVR